MSEFFEIAYAAASGRLCLFTGTGFSKAVTEDKAPSWQGLLELMCDMTSDPDSLKKALFPENGTHPLSLEEAAQIISLELSKREISIHDEISKIIEKIKPSGDNSIISNFLSKRSFEVITTNYDKLLETLSNEGECHSITPGLPIPRSPARVQVYHVHGSIDSPGNMVVTSDDYFKFIHSESYFSRKLSTILHENTVVIIGYSLGDANLKSIISDYQGFSKNHVISSNIFLISRSKVDQHIKDYYSHCYGIRVLDSLSAHDFFQKITDNMPAAERCSEISIKSLNNVLYHNYEFTDDYLKIENSFFEIISALGAIGKSINNNDVVSSLGKIIETKIRLTKEPGAWTQYEHLARWLIYLATILELRGKTIEPIYLHAALHSMKSMRKGQFLGYSWHAYTAWNSGWSKIISANRIILKKHIESQTDWPDALAVVNSI
ncbi:SIR2 family protein [Janthinobacterium sp. GW460P]|uniref:SIR2 family protein n=1 Tax=unclassified Janthinobacterium TaxID=2610881 RepID=UPI000A325E19|nr:MULTISPECIES: SIR2 family protein [unclassified Janthinobacterium]MCC7705210.1 SIR2 family protein [Janthinobacterium sp. GW460P]MCC7710695.1 SIR2 family protein [Janthinobacterium sp. GW460W]